jgi:transposase
MSKFTQRRRTAIIRKIREGSYIEVAARSNGIAPKTFYEWMKRGEAEGAEEHDPEYHEFANAVRDAEAAGEAKAAKQILEQGKADAKHLQWWLERKYPERWGRREAVDVTSKGQPLRTIEVVRTIREDEAEEA